MKAFILLAALLLPAVAFAHDSHDAGIGQPGKATAKTRVVRISMAAPMRFTPASVKVAAGETVRFVLTNTDDRAHEFMLGEIKALQAHAVEMQKHPEMVHDEANAITLLPGQSGELVWTFPKSGVVDFACLLPGHFDAGMQGRIEVRR
jgi:uncharacterized cupredoxin-like copper-binding protein